MDKRQMKKHILWFALSDLLTEALGSEGGARYELATYILDKDVDHLTISEYKRFVNLLQEMVDNAESKLK